MKLIDRLRQRHEHARSARQIDRALRSAPTQAMRDEILLISQRRGS